MPESTPPFLRSLKSEEFLPPISRWTSVGGLILIGAVGAGIALATFFRYNVTVNAAAVVRPSGELRVVQSELTGTIAQIDVRENQVVQQGDVIARLDRTQLETQKSQLEATLRQGQLQISQMNIQIELLNTQIAAETQAINQSVSVAQSELDRNQRTYQDQQTTTQADLAEAEAALALAQSEADRYQQLVDSGAVSQLQLDEKLAALRTAQAQIARAQAALNPTAAAVSIAQEQIAQERSRGQATLATLNRERELLVQQRLELQTQLLQDQKQLQQVDRDLQRSDIRATSDGVIFQLNLRNANQVVNPGDTIAQIAPSGNGVVVKANVATQDIDKVRMGQSAVLRINACPYPDYGTLRGVVTAIAPDAVVPQDSRIIDPYFEVTIQPDAFVLVNSVGVAEGAEASPDRQCQIQSGMGAEAQIISREETLLQFVLRKARLTTGF